VADTYDPERCAALCELIANGMPWSKACAELNLVPSTAWRWRGSHPEFRDAYNDATTRRAHLLADDLIDIADGATENDVQVAKLRVDTRKWLASKLLPKNYGDKVAVDVEANVNHFVVEVPAPLSRDEWLQRFSGDPSLALKLPS
jgi:hypothetical protein